MSKSKKQPDYQTMRLGEIMLRAGRGDKLAKDMLDYRTAENQRQPKSTEGTATDRYILRYRTKTECASRINKATRFEDWPL